MTIKCLRFQKPILWPNSHFKDSDYFEDKANVYEVVTREPSECASEGYPGVTIGSVPGGYFVTFWFRNYRSPKKPDTKDKRFIPYSNIIEAVYADE